MISFFGATNTLRFSSLGLMAIALSQAVASASPVVTTVGYNPAALESNFSAPEAQNDVVAYSVSVDSDAANIYVTLQALPAGIGQDNWTDSLNFANLYFGVGSGYQGANFGIEVENNLAFIPGGANGPADLSTYGVTETTTLGTPYGSDGTATGSSVELTLPWSYLMTDPDNLGFTKVSGSNPNVMLRDSQSFSYSYVGGASFGPNRFGVVTYPDVAAAPEPSTWMMLLAGTLLMGIVYKRRLKTVRVR